MISYSDRGRSGHKQERWGKKYQWIAYHELLARIADNYEPMPDYWDNRRKTYDGPQELSSVRDLDPSLPPIPYRRLEAGSELPDSTWAPSPYNEELPYTIAPPIDFSLFNGSVEKFTDDTSSQPRAQDFIFTTRDGQRWIAVDAFEIQSESPGEWDKQHLQQTSTVTTAFVKRSSSISDAKKMAAGSRNDWHSLELHGHTNCCFFGEFGWTPRACEHRLPDWRVIETNGMNVDVADVCEDYMWEGSGYDCSIGESVKATLPSTFILNRSDLRAANGGRHLLDENGSTVVLNGQERSLSRQVAYFRLDWLVDFSNRHNLALLLLVWSDRLLVDTKRTGKFPRAEERSSAVLLSNGSLKQVAKERQVEIG